MAVPREAALPRHWLKPICRRFFLSQAHLCAAQMCHHKTSWHLHGAPQHRISKPCCVCGRPQARLCFEGWGVSSVDHRAGACLGRFFHCEPLTTGDYSLQGTYSSPQEVIWPPSPPQGLFLGMAAASSQRCCTILRTEWAEKLWVQVESLSCWVRLCKPPESWANTACKASSFALLCLLLHRAYLLLPAGPEQPLVPEVGNEPRDHSHILGTSNRSLQQHQLAHCTKGVNWYKIHYM